VTRCKVARAELDAIRHQLGKPPQGLLGKPGGD
jgi:hypothetical protein